MIIIIISSRLGNQLFQYAFAYATSKSLNTYFLINKTTAKHGYILDRYFTLGYFSLFKKYFYKLLFQFFRKKDFKKVKQTGFDSTNLILDNITDFTEYSGYFQSLDYFFKYEDEIKKIFRIKAKYLKEFKQNHARKFHRKTIVVHIRRTDYLTFKKTELGGDNFCLPDDYYIKIINNIENLGSYNLIFISDDIYYVKYQFSPLYPNARYEQNSEITDFQFLVNADILILSNSTFAWWGAFLNSRPNKRVYIPKYWLGFKVKKEYPTGIIHPLWTVVDFN